MQDVYGFKANKSKEKIPNIFSNRYAFWDESPFNLSIDSIEEIPANGILTACFSLEPFPSIVLENFSDISNYTLGQYTVVASLTSKNIVAAVPPIFTIGAMLSFVYIDGEPTPALTVNIKNHTNFDIPLYNTVTELNVTLIENV